MGASLIHRHEVFPGSTFMSVVLTARSNQRTVRESICECGRMPISIGSEKLIEGSAGHRS